MHKKAANDVLQATLHQTVRFEPNHSVLTSEGMSVLDRVAKHLGTGPNKHYRIIVKGLSSASGPSGTKLVKGRVKTTIRYLAGKGVKNAMTPRGMIGARQIGLEIFIAGLKNKPPGCGVEGPATKTVTVKRLRCIREHRPAAAKPSAPATPQHQWSGAAEKRFKVAGLIERKWKKLASVELAKKELQSKKWTWKESSGKRYSQKHPDSTARRSVDGAVAVDDYPGADILPHFESWIPPFVKVPKSADKHRELTWKTAINEAQSNKERTFKKTQLSIQWPVGLSVQEVMSVQAWMDAAARESSMKELQLKAKTCSAEAKLRAKYSVESDWITASVEKAWGKEAAWKKLSWLKTGVARMWARPMISPPAHTNPAAGMNAERAIKSHEGKEKKIAASTNKIHLKLSKKQTKNIQDHVGQQIRSEYATIRHQQGTIKEAQWDNELGQLMKDFPEEADQLNQLPEEQLHNTKKLYRNLLKRYQADLLAAKAQLTQQDQQRTGKLKTLSSKLKRYKGMTNSFQSNIQATKDKVTELQGHIKKLKGQLAAAKAHSESTAHSKHAVLLATRDRLKFQRELDSAHRSMTKLKSQMQDVVHRYSKEFKVLKAANRKASDIQENEIASLVEYSGVIKGNLNMLRKEITQHKDFQQLQKLAKTTYNGVGDVMRTINDQHGMYEEAETKAASHWHKVDDIDNTIRSNLDISPTVLEEAPHKETAEKKPEPKVAPKRAMKTSVAPEKVMKTPQVAEKVQTLLDKADKLGNEQSDKKMHNKKMHKTLVKKKSQQQQPKKVFKILQPAQSDEVDGANESMDAPTTKSLADRVAALQAELAATAVDANEKLQSVDESESEMQEGPAHGSPDRSDNSDRSDSSGRWSDEDYSFSQQSAAQDEVQQKSKPHSLQTLQARSQSSMDLLSSLVGNLHMPPSE
jgi:hypothetical protein